MYHSICNICRRNLINLLIRIAISVLIIHNSRLICGRSFNEAFPDSSVISLNDTLKHIYSGNKLSVKPHYLGPNFELLADGRITTSCLALFKTLLKDNEVIKDCEITEILQNAFTLDHLTHGEERCPDKLTFKKHNKSNVNAWIWTKKLIKNKADLFKTCHVYKNSACEESVSKYNHFIKDKVGMVLGTLIPWAEAGLLHHGAREIITVEYNPINIRHPQIKAIHPIDVAKQYIDNQFEPVDFIFSYSSLEHDGLGRLVEYCIFY